ncbi:hypothetical protein V2J09_009444 [Rumex salicifolius]
MEILLSLTATLHIFLVLLWCAALPSLTDSASVQEKKDAEALVLFKNMIDSDPNGVLSSWKSLKSPCSWERVTCNSQGRVAAIDLSWSFLGGPVNFAPFSSIDMLTSLNLSTNYFTVNSSSLLQLPFSLQELQLSGIRLHGVLPASDLFSRCPNLVSVDLSYNNFTGFEPASSLSISSKLEVLDLSFNRLAGDVSVDAPPTSSLSSLDLSHNQISGSIPVSLSNCTGLKTLNLSMNMITGEIPKSFGRLSSLQRFDVSHNYLTGAVPGELGGACDSLQELRLGHNNLSGLIPTTLSSCSWLQILDFSNNNLSGPFPESILSTLGSLEILLLSNNAISGPLPTTISACKNLRVVDFSSNKLSGSIPPDICPARSNSSLEELRLPDNLFSGKIPKEISQCTELQTLDLSLNFLTGPIPGEIGKLENLERLIAWYNNLEGKIPRELGQCGSLKDLILNNNMLEGEIPKELFSCSNLEWVSLTSNVLTGQVPTEFGILTRLAVLQLANNSFAGEIPATLSNCSSLVWLDMSANKLTGQIPARIGRQQGSKPLSGILSGNTLVFVRNVGNSCKGVGGLLEFAGIRPERLLQVPTLKNCDFTRMYSGPILSLFTQYQTLEYLDLSYNDLQGSIPNEFGEMVALQVLEISYNNLSGEIPASLGQLKNLGVFDASHNRFQGPIPDSFSNLSFLVQIDLSNNQLTGQIPTRGQLSTLPATQYANNPGLCGVPLPECPPAPESPYEGGRRKKSSGTPWTNSIVIGVLISITCFCILSVWAIAMRARRREAVEAKMLRILQRGDTATTWKIDKEREPLSINVATFQRQLRKLKFSQLIEATNGFSADSLIGCGGFGEVFKATLKDGSNVAIKKLIQLSYQGDREFMAEMETLGKIKHKNLVPLLGYCKVGEERLLVYEFMEYGNLEDMLHGKTATRSSFHKERKGLTWEERKKIARGAAKGLCFLHHNCIPHIIHRDMKSSNVLLDQEMEARVSDFGMARLISALDTHLSVSSLAGTPGYVPPEYYQSFRCTAKGDVYSFGVVLLELLTGKRPTDKDDFGDTNLVGWVKMKVREGSRMEVIEPELLLLALNNTNVNAKVVDEEDQGVDGVEVNEMLRYLEITMQCVDDFPSKRPNMLQVVAMLRDLVPPAIDSDASNNNI